MSQSGKEQDKREAWLIDQLTKSEFFHQKLHEYGLIEVAYAIEEVRGEKLNWDLEDLGISHQAWGKVIHRGIKPVRVFAHPHLLTTIPRATAYYRGLAMVSQKSMRNIRLNVDHFEAGQRVPDDRTAQAVARRLNELISRLVESDEQIDEREFDLWRGMTAGAQAQGSWQNRKGAIVEEHVKELIRHRTRERELIVREEAEGATAFLHDGRTLHYGSEPDIAVYGQNDEILAAVEIKGGIDPAGVLERVGAAIKSLSRAKQENPAAVTVLIMYGVSMSEQARQDLQAHRSDIDRWFTIEDVLNSEDTQARIYDLLAI